jgi:hypothetical protein
VKALCWVAAALAIVAPRAAHAQELAIRPFVFGSVEMFAAVDTFDAVFGRSYEPMFGGGLQLVSDDTYFLELSASRLRQTGQRAFISNGQKFGLGVPLTASLTPLEATAGYRFRLSPRLRERVKPYLGAGGGLYFYKESSDFADAAFDLEARHAGFLASGGAEFRLHRLVGLAIDVQYTYIPGILGRGGVSQQAGENDLGGVAGRVKVVVGR